MQLRHVLVVHRVRPACVVGEVDHQPVGRFQVGREPPHQPAPAAGVGQHQLHPPAARLPRLVRGDHEISARRQTVPAARTRMLRMTSSLTRKPAKIRTTPSSSPRKNAQVTPNRLRPEVMLGTSPPRAIRIVAGTRELSRRWSSAETAPGTDAARFTITAAKYHSWASTGVRTLPAASSFRFGM